MITKIRKYLTEKFVKIFYKNKEIILKKISKCIKNSDDINRN